jgi:hypothetical protein
MLLAPGWKQSPHQTGTAPSSSSRSGIVTGRSSDGSIVACTGTTTGADITSNKAIITVIMIIVISTFDVLLLADFCTSEDNFFFFSNIFLS